MIYCLKLAWGPLRGRSLLLSHNGLLLDLLDIPVTEALERSVRREEDGSWSVGLPWKVGSCTARGESVQHSQATTTEAVWIDPEVQSTLAGTRSRAVGCAISRFVNLSVGPLSPLRASGIQDLSWIRDFVADTSPGSSILEVGCGSGVLSQCLARMGFRVIATDVCLREVVPSPGVTYVEADVQALPLPSDRVDAVLAGFVLEHVPNPLMAMEEMIRVVRPGGRIWVSLPVIDSLLDDAMIDIPFFHLHVFTSGPETGHAMDSTGELLSYASHRGARLLRAVQQRGVLRGKHLSMDQHDESGSPIAADWVLWILEKEGIG